MLFINVLSIFCVTHPIVPNPVTVGCFLILQRKKINKPDDQVKPKNYEENKKNELNQFRLMLIKLKMNKKELESDEQ
ncbi:hypothetical protein NUSPORA_00919 [Nucleospora cyclopteri]